jgi:glycosyltransferase involved in cell wall biosynthesis
MKNRKPLNILVWPLSTPNNSYPSALNGHLAKRAKVSGVVRGKALVLQVLKERFDILQIHWLESPFWTRKSLILKFVLASIVSLLILKMKGGKIVWTAHDPVPHEMQGNEVLAHGFYGWLWRTYSAFVIHLTDGVILLSKTHGPDIVTRYPRLAARFSTVIPHPHYRGVYPDDITREDARISLAMTDGQPTLLFLGNVRPYKNAEGLIAAFRASTANARLIIAGEVENENYVKTLRALSGNDPRIELKLDYIADDMLQLYLRAADVVVIPFRHVTNSGSVMLALSFDCPVAIPRVPVFEELHDSVGDAWIKLFDGEIAAPAIEDIVSWAQTDRSPQPNLDSYDWETIADKTVEFFQAIRAGSAKRLQQFSGG